MFHLICVHCASGLLGCGSGVCSAPVLNFFVFWGNWQMGGDVGDSDINEPQPGSQRSQDRNQAGPPDSIGQSQVGEEGASEAPGSVFDLMKSHLREKNKKILEDARIEEKKRRNKPKEPGQGDVQVDKVCFHVVCSFSAVPSLLSIQHER